MDINKANDLITKLNNTNECPSWAIVLVEVMKEVLNEIKNISSLVNRVNELESCKVISDRVSDELKHQNKKLNEKVSKMSKQIDEQEQRSRNECLLIHGIEERDDDNTDSIAIQIITHELGVELTLDEIQRSHRVGPKNQRRNTRSSNPRPRPIIVRFSNWRKRREVFSVKKKLKGKGISITENLTKYRYDLLKEAIEMYGKGNVWTIDGRITTKLNNTYVVITCSGDLK